MNETVRLSVRKPNLYISEEMNEQIKTFRFDNRFDSEAAAQRELISLGLAASEAGLASVLQDGSEEKFEQIRAVLKEFAPSS